MASTTFVDFQTPVVASWLNDVNSVVYSAFGGVIPTTPIQTLNALGLSVNVKNFGAVDDNVTDSYPAFVAALASGANHIQVTGGTYFLSQGITIPAGVTLEGDSMLPGNPATGTKLRFANVVANCITLNGVIAGTGGGTCSLRRMIITRTGTPPANSNGVLVRGAYNSIIEDIFSLNHDNGFYFLGQGGLVDPTLANGIACSMTRVYTGAISNTHFVVDSWPELRISQGRAGMNGTGDYAGTTFVKITSPNGGTGGAGPNTIIFNNFQFNQGGTAGPQYWIYFTNNTAGVGNQVIYQFNECHIENITTAYIKSDSTAGYIQKLKINNCILNSPKPLWAVDPATKYYDCSFTGVTSAATPMTMGANYVSGLTITGCDFIGVTATLTAVPTNNWMMSLVGNTWGATSSLTIAGTGWAQCNVNDSFSFDSTLTDTTQSPNVQIINYKRAINTWTPVLNIGGSSTGITFSANGGTYQVVGRILTLNFRMLLSSKGANAGAVTITGMPFNAAGSNLDAWGGTCAYVQNLSGLTGSLTARVSNGSTITLSMAGTGGTTDISNTNLNNNSIIYGSLSYAI